MQRTSFASRVESKLVTHNPLVSKVREARLHLQRLARDHCFHLCLPPSCTRTIALAAVLFLASSASAFAAPASPEPVYLLGIPVDFILFALTLLGVALFHHHTLRVALTGLAAIVVFKLAFTGFKF